MEDNPRKVFFQLFGQGDNAAERLAIRDETRSILDFVQGETSSLQDNWCMGGGEDGRLFDFGAVFDLEQGQLCGSECLDVCRRHGGVRGPNLHLE